MVSTAVLLVLVAACSVFAVLLLIICLVFCRRLVEKFGEGSSRSMQRCDDTVFHIPVPVMYTESDSRYVLIPPSDTSSLLPGYTPTDPNPTHIAVDGDPLPPDQHRQSATQGTDEHLGLDRPPSYMEALASAKEVEA